MLEGVVQPQIQRERGLPIGIDPKPLPVDILVPDDLAWLIYEDPNKPIKEKDMKVKDCVALRRNYSGRLFGIEIEVEAEALPDEDEIPTNWRKVNDGSLRGVCAEYIFASPKPLGKTKECIKDLVDVLHTEGENLSFSQRTSIHVHVNVADLELKEVLKVISLYYLFEDSLLKFCGTDRYSNRFCLSIREAEGVLFALKSHFNQYRLTNLSLDLLKYASLNLGAITDKGTLEFRGMRGTDDLDVIFTWLDLIDNLFTTALACPSVDDMFKKVWGGRHDVLAKPLFKEHIALLGRVHEVDYNASLCAELPSIERNLK